MPRIILVPDIMQHDNQHKIEQSRNFTYENIISPEILSIFKDADLVIGNLETTLGEKELSGYPSFRTHANILNSLSDIDIFVCANNHMNDFGIKGIVETKRHIEAAGKYHVGILGNNFLHLTDGKGNKYMIHAFSRISNKPMEDPIFMNMDFINAEVPDDTIGIVYSHEGTEYSPELTITQKYTKLRALTCGYSAAVMIHSHVIGNYQSLENNGKLFVTNGLGNFISDQQNLDRQLGRFVELDICPITKQIKSIINYNTETIIVGNSQRVMLLSKEKIK